MEKKASGIPAWRAIIYIILLLLIAGVYFFPELKRAAVNMGMIKGSGLTAAEAREGEKLIATSIPREKTPVVLEFSSVSCSICAIMKPEILKLAYQFRGKVVFVDASVDADYGAELADRFQVHGLPTFYLLDSSHNVVGFYEGGVPIDTLKDSINQMIGK